VMPPVKGSKVVGFCPKNSEDDMLGEGGERGKERERGVTKVGKEVRMGERREE
jgi:hypothetical protein